MKPEELYELRIGGKVTQKELAAHLSVDRRIAEKSSSAPLLSRSSGAYVNLHKVPMTGTSLAESLIMRNLIRFLRFGMSRLMGKNTPKGRQYYILAGRALFCRWLRAELRFQLVDLKSHITRYRGFGLVL